MMNKVCFKILRSPRKFRC